MSKTRIVKKTKILQSEIDGESIASRLLDYFRHVQGIDERQSIAVNRRFLLFKERYDKEDSDDPVFELKRNRIVRNVAPYTRHDGFAVCNHPDNENQEPNERSPIPHWRHQLDFLMSVRGALALDHGQDAANDEIKRFLESGQSELVKEAGSGFVPMPHIVSLAEKQKTTRKREREKKSAWKAKRAPEQIERDREKERLKKSAQRARRTPEQIEQARQRDRERKRAARMKLKSLADNSAQSNAEDPAA